MQIIKNFKPIGILFLFFILQFYAKAQPFVITSDSLAENVEKNIDRYPDQIRINLLLKLAIYHINADPRKTAELSTKAIAQIRELDNPKYDITLLHSYIMAGNSYHKLGSEYFASNAYLNAYDIAEKINNESLQLLALKNLSNALMNQSNYLMAVEYLNRAEKIAFKQNKKDVLNALQIQLAEAYIFLNRTDSAKFILNNLFVDLTDTTDLIVNHINYSKVKVIEKDFIGAQRHLNEALLLSKSINNDSLAYECYSQLARTSALVNNFFEAEFYLEKAYALKKKNDNMSSLISSAEIYEKNKNYKEANAYYKRFYLAADSAIKEKDKLSTQNFTNQVDLISKAREINSLKLKNAKNEKDIKKTRLLIIISSTLFLLLVVSSYFIVNYQREKHHNLQLIVKQNEELSLKKHKEELRKAELRAAIAQLQGQEIERERLAKELHDGVGGTLAGIKMELESIFGGIKSDKKAAYLIKSLQDTYMEVRSISKNLSLPNFSSESLNENILNLIQFFPGKHDLEINFNAFPLENWDDIDINTQKEIYRMIQEAITNAIKHAKASEMDIQIVNDGTSLTMIIEDNGIGFDTNKIWSGIGLKNMKSRATVLKGELSIESEPGEGTTINLIIPLKN
ncbi:ATP-binding protein [Saccharicrinis sp. FJH54]|uniref:tetratricopeptide repeat-containing sensor histidine kinase n=1 Tax=Saccharicrinis sp. FJH54 TaxID=3344665 RepID=UPI0035D4BB18